MRPMIKVMILMALSLNISISFASINKKYSSEQYHDDIDQLVKTIKDNHPRPFKFISEKQFAQLVKDKKNKISDKTTYGQFIWDVSEILAAIGCGHSSFRYYFNQENQMLPIEYRFPMDVKVFDNKLYITDPLVNSSHLSKGQEIMAINGKKASVILTDIYKHIFSDANLVGTKRHIFNAYANSYLAYYFNFPGAYSIRLRDKNSPIKLKALTEYQFKPMISPKDTCQDSLCLEFIEDDTAKLTIRTFNYYGKKSKVFEDFVDDSFGKIKRRKSKSLIIDVRGNRGGNSFSAAYLLAHIATKTFTFYKQYAPGAERLKQPIDPYPNAFPGNVFVITDGSDSSSTGFFLALVKSYGFGTIVGSDSGSNFTTNAGYKDHELSNTGILYRVSTAIMDTNVEGLTFGEPIKPDYRVTQSIDDYLDGIDTYLIKTLELARTRNDNKNSANQ